MHYYSNKVNNMFCFFKYRELEMLIQLAAN